MEGTIAKVSGILVPQVMPFLRSLMLQSRRCVCSSANLAPRSSPLPTKSASGSGRNGSTYPRSKDLAKRSPISNRNKNGMRAKKNG